MGFLVGAANKLWTGCPRNFGLFKAKAKVIFPWKHPKRLRQPPIKLFTGCRRRVIKLTTHPHLQTSLRMSGVIPALPSI